MQANQSSVGFAMRCAKAQGARRTSLQGQYLHIKPGRIPSRSGKVVQREAPTKWIFKAYTNTNIYLLISNIIYSSFLILISTNNFNFFVLFRATE